MVNKHKGVEWLSAIRHSIVYRTGQHRFGQRDIEILDYFRTLLDNPTQVVAKAEIIDGKCSGCGNKLRLSDIFCSKCGLQVRDKEVM